MTGMTAMATSDRLSITVESASVSFGPQEVLRDINLTAHSGARLGVVGQSGSGKSTLARLLVGLLNPHAGSVLVDGRPWRRVRHRDPLRRAVQLIQQDPYAQLTPHLSAHRAVSEAARICRRIGQKEASHLGYELLESVGLNPNLARRKPRHLSGGQCQRVTIARALASDARILIADEPTSALDVSVQAQIINLLLEVTADRQRGLVLVSHDLPVVRHLTDEIVVLHEGRIIEAGTTEHVLANPEHAYTRKLCSASGGVPIRPAENTVPIDSIGIAPSLSLSPPADHAGTVTPTRSAADPRTERPR
ncbi:MAG: ATP-binding cassette domain-containing protein [Nocardioidaceae bacterium]|nr:ATP-binding cassette domain-containing protein [Nocardioidaceae bacterium]